MPKCKSFRDCSFFSFSLFRLNIYKKLTYAFHKIKLLDWGSDIQVYFIDISPSPILFVCLKGNPNAVVPSVRPDLYSDCISI